MQHVFVIDKNKQPLMPCHPARARALLKQGLAAVYQRYPFTLILLEREGGEVQELELKIDPGSKQTGLAVVLAGQRGRRICWAAVLSHRGHTVKANLDGRRTSRRSRRARHTRYRPARFNNRRRAAGWLPPSLNSRLDNILNWRARLSRWLPLSSIALERVKFDMQLLENAEISGIEYQQGTLAGYEIRQYLLEKWNRQCAYCGKRDVPLQIEHIVPRSRDGSNRVDNLTLACHACNEAKGTLTAAEFGHPALHDSARKPLKDAAAVNATRKALHQRLVATGLPTETASGGQTQFNRTKQGYPKAHWIDAACIGTTGQAVYLPQAYSPLLIKATGRGSRQMCRMDKFGFPRTGPKTVHRIHGFQTGDLARAIVPTGQLAGTYLGRLAVRATGNFNITTPSGTTQGIAYRHCRLLHRCDGYTYHHLSRKELAFPPLP